MIVTLLRNICLFTETGDSVHLKAGTVFTTEQRKPESIFLVTGEIRIPVSEVCLGADIFDVRKEVVKSVER